MDMDDFCEAGTYSHCFWIWINTGLGSTYTILSSFPTKVDYHILIFHSSVLQSCLLFYLSLCATVRFPTYNSLLWTNIWYLYLASLVAQLVKNPPAMQMDLGSSLGWEDPLEKGKATYSSVLAWRIPWTIQPMGSQRVGTRLSESHFLFFIRCILTIPININLKIFFQPQGKFMLPFYILQ